MAIKTHPSRKTSSSTTRAAGKTKAAPKAKSGKKTTAAVTGRPAATAGGDNSPAGLLARAEADMAKLVDSLNTQMASAMNVLTDLAVAQRGRGEPIVRTKPVDRATAMFQRLITEVVDDKLAETLPTLVALRGEMHQRAKALAGSPSTSDSASQADREFLERGTAMLDQVLTNVDVHALEPRIGDPFDPLIQLAVGETHRDDLRDGVVAEVLQPGFRTARGKVVVAARVKVNRR